MPHFSWVSIGSAVAAASLLVAPFGAQAQSSPASVHVVQEGDTLLQIALDANTDVPTLVALNSLADAEGLLSIGQSLKLPPSGPAPASGSGSGSTSGSS